MGLGQGRGSCDSLRYCQVAASIVVQMITIRATRNSGQPHATGFPKDRTLRRPKTTSSDIESCVCVVQLDVPILLPSWLVEL